MILWGTLYSVAGTVALHIPYSDRVVNGLAQVLSGDTDSDSDLESKDERQDVNLTTRVREIDTFGIATGSLSRKGADSMGRPALRGRSNMDQDENQDENKNQNQNQNPMSQPQLCYHTYCDTCDLLPTLSSFGINKLARNRSHNRTVFDGRDSPAPHLPPREYVAAQNDKFDDLVSRNLESLEASPKWWSPFQSPQLSQHDQFELKEFDAYLPTPPESAKRSEDLDFLMASLSRDSKEHLLRKLQRDLGSAEMYDSGTLGTQQSTATETFSSGSYLEKLDRFVHLCVLLTILIIRAIIPYLRSLYQQFRQDKLYLLNRKNFSRTVDIALALMQALESSLQPGSRLTPWQVISQLLAYPKNFAKRTIAKRLASRKTQDNTRVGKWRRAAVEYVIRSYLSPPGKSDSAGANPSIQATFNLRDSVLDYAQYFSPSYQPQKAPSTNPTISDQSEILFSEILQTLAQEL